METAKYYVVTGNAVTNIIVCTEEYAAKNNLIRYPVSTQYGVADMNWTFIDNTFLPPPRDILKEWEAVRRTRDALLMASDVLVLPDRWQTYTAEQQQAVSNYRQTLRNIPQSFIDPQEVVFPQPPVIA